jgi:hypothetical protein
MLMISRQSGIRAVLALAAALVLVAGALLFQGTPSSQEALLRAAPSELALPADPAQLGQWCVDRQAAGTAGLSRGARNWLEDCIELFGSGITPAPTGSASASPSPTSPTPSPSASTNTPSSSPTSSPGPSPTPTASPSPTGSASPTGPMRNCLAQLAACGFPHAGNTGPTGPLTVVNGNVTLSTAGMVFRAPMATTVATTFGCAATPPT